MSGFDKETFAIPGLAIQPTRLGFGGAAAGGHGWGAHDDTAALATIRRATEAGITFFDTSDVYGLGRSEELFAHALEKRLQEVVIATKGGVRWDATGRTWRDSSPQYIATAAEASLRRLCLDSIPLYYLHWPDGNTPLEESVAALLRLQEEGKIETFGLSNISPTQLVKAIKWGVAAVQIKGNLLEPDAIRGIAPAAVAGGVPVICYSSLSDGLLTGKFNRATHFGRDDHRSRYPLFRPEVFPTVLARVETLKKVANSIGRTPAQTALRWLLDTPGVSAALCGGKTPDQVDELLGVFGWRTPPGVYEDMAYRIPWKGTNP